MGASGAGFYKYIIMLHTSHSYRNSAAKRALYIHVHNLTSMQTSLAHLRRYLDTTSTYIAILTLIFSTEESAAYGGVDGECVAPHSGHR